MSSSATTHDIPEKESSSSREKADSSTVNNYIASLHLERADTKAGSQNAVQRRKTLLKQARDPKADQAALEQEIRHIERIASLLGRRQTRFDRKHNFPVVNHDLDDTLDGFFDVQEEDERVNEELLSGDHSTVFEDDESGGGGDLADPVLKEKNIHSAPTALIAQQQAAEYDNAEDPFDQIEDMQLENSPSGSAEYLPIDSYKSDKNVIDSADDKQATRLSVSMKGLNIDSNKESNEHIVGGKVDGCSNNEFELDSPTCNDDVIAEIARSNTWKRQSMALIREREHLGPALPQIANIDEEDEEDKEDDQEKGAANPPSDSAPRSAATAAEQIYAERLPGAVVVLSKPSSATAPPVSALAVPASASESKPTFKNNNLSTNKEGAMPPIDDIVLLSSTSAVEEYLDILDFIDGKAQPGGEFNDHTFNDGHISSDLQGNSDSSDSSDIDLSDGGGCSSDSDDSDSKYLARLNPKQPRLRLANVISTSAASLQTDAASNLSSQQDRHVFHDSNSKIELDKSIDSNSAAQVQQLHGVAKMPGSAGTGISGIPGRSTLRRSRRVLGKGRSLRSDPSTRWVSKLPALQSAKSESVAVSVSRMKDERVHRPETEPAVPKDSPSGDRDIASAVASVNAMDAAETGKLGSPNSIRPESLVSNVAVQTKLPGLAKLAEEAVAASKSKKHAGRTGNTLSSKMPHRPLPSAPDRILHTLDAADADIASSSSGVVRSPPPLPTKERPRVPKVLGGDKLDKRVQVEVELERPSSQRMFSLGSLAAASSEQALQQSSSALNMSSPTLPISPSSPAASIRRPETAQSSARDEERRPSSSSGPSSALSEWLRRTDIMLPSNNPAAAKLSPYPPGSSSKTITFNTYHYEQQQPIEGSATSAADNLRPGSRRKARGRVVRKIAVLPPSQLSTAAQHSRPASSSSSVYSSLSQQGNSPAHSPIRSNLNSPHSNHRASVAPTASIPTQKSSNSNNSNSPSVLAALPMAYSSSSCSGTYVQAHTANVAANGAYSFSPMPAINDGPTVLSAPPGASEMYDSMANFSAGMVEPSAPMLPEPTAPEVPQQWEVSSPQAYAFPMPVHYVTNSTQDGYNVKPLPSLPISLQMSPHVSTATDTAGSLEQQQGHSLSGASYSQPAQEVASSKLPPKLPDKPRPLSVPLVPLAPLPPPPQATHRQTAPDITIEEIVPDLIAAAAVSKNNKECGTGDAAALLSPTGGFVMNVLFYAIRQTSKGQDRLFQASLAAWVLLFDRMREPRFSSNYITRVLAPLLMTMGHVLAHGSHTTAPPISRFSRLHHAQRQ
ncbi:hypothetical protein GGI25_005706 [Coemansia spiralis]|uniref:Uncharacterized protein n=1 Tax=Coemansia spiralis TaxID=417178 RepID=A0A9W8KUF3_9FUNG|nr:hypothetical protein GGI26_000369 [Coemansia sp. RSA 1358]KAJ2670828.1 hypothetical protein GGI25_005706 [Coemansia spiralis]